MRNTTFKLHSNEYTSGKKKLSLSECEKKNKQTNLHPLFLRKPRHVIFEICTSATLLALIPEKIKLEGKCFRDYRDRIESGITLTEENFFPCSLK